MRHGIEQKNVHGIALRSSIPIDGNGNKLFVVTTLKKINIRFNRHVELQLR